MFARHGNKWLNGIKEYYEIELDYCYYKIMSSKDLSYVNLNNIYENILILNIYVIQKII